MGLTSVSVIMTVFVLNLHYRGPNDSPVPNWVRRLLVVVQTATGSRTSSAAHRRRHRRRPQPHRGLTFRGASTYVDEYLSDDADDADDTNDDGDDGGCGFSKAISLRMTIEDLADELTEELELCSNGGGGSRRSSGGGGGGGGGIPPGRDEPYLRHYEDGRGNKSEAQSLNAASHPTLVGNHCRKTATITGHVDGDSIGARSSSRTADVPNHDDSTSAELLLPTRRPPQIASTTQYRQPVMAGPRIVETAAASTGGQGYANEEILRALRKIINRYEREDTDGEIIYEWRRVANAVDRLLFWIFFVGTFGSTIGVLVIAPLCQHL